MPPPQPGRAITTFAAESDGSRVVAPPTAGVPQDEGMRTPVPVFVIDGRDIELYPDAESAAAEVEGHDAIQLEFIGADGTVYEGVVEGPEWGPVSLRDTGRNGLPDLTRRLRAEAAARSVTLSAEVRDEPTAIWQVVLDAELAQRKPRRRW